MGLNIDELRRAGWQQQMDANAAAAEDKWQLGGPGGGYGGLFGVQPQEVNFGGHTFTVNPTWQQLFGAGAKQAMETQAPTIATGPQDQWRNQQSTLGQMLMAQANGGGPNLADAQLRQATDRNIAQAMAMASANPNQAGVLRGLASNVGAMNQQAAADSATARMQQQLASQSMLGSLLQGARSQDLGLAADQARMQQQQYGLNQNAAQNYLGMGMGAANSQLQANIARNQIAAQRGLAADARENAILGGLIGGAGSVLANYAGRQSPPPANTPTPAPTGRAYGGEITGPEYVRPYKDEFEDEYADERGLAHFGLDGPQAKRGGGGSGLKVAGLAGGAIGTAIGGPVGGVIGGTIGSMLGFAGGGQVGWPSGPMAGGVQAGGVPQGRAPSSLWYSPPSRQQLPSPRPMPGGGYNTGAVPPHMKQGGYGGVASPVPWGAPPPTGGFMPPHMNQGQPVYASLGGYVPGAGIGMDSPANDTVPAMLSPKEIVLPRSVTLAEDAPERAKAFVEAILAAKKKKKAV